MASSGGAGAASSSSSAGRPMTVLKGRALQERINVAKQNAYEGIVAPLQHLKFCILGLLCLQLIRVISWKVGAKPMLTLLPVHLLSAMSDFICLACAIPLVVSDVLGPCVRYACLGPTVTMVCAMLIVDTLSLVAYCFMAPPRPMPPGFVPLPDKLENLFGSWESILLGSVALEFALVTAAWRIYRELRLQGLYPPGSDALAKNKVVDHVSVMEVFCEAEDIALLSDCGARHCGTLAANSDETTELVTS
eukprot:TRINITY_DN28391_c0_g1_i1.p1 TRINITY_DN28391_c0_g1~~TRINITY_DN28391_c0_g1_i1.p1  ORF type:complete len:249 (+),score=49.24 TRINITY_DN28391_c0_g1_i1:119-865(+)